MEYHYTVNEFYGHYQYENSSKETITVDRPKNVTKPLFSSLMEQNKIEHINMILVLDLVITDHRNFFNNNLLCLEGLDFVEKS